jgi:hypothetical protein
MRMKPARATTSGVVRLERARELGVEVGALGERAVVDDVGGDAVPGGEGEPGGVGAVADDGGDARVPAFVGAGAHDRLHVRAATGNEDDDVLHRRRSVSARSGANLQSTAFAADRR